MMYVQYVCIALGYKGEKHFTTVYVHDFTEAISRMFFVVLLSFND